MTEREETQLNIDTTLKHNSGAVTEFDPPTAPAQHFRQANEFIVYWLPLMEQNPYNIISFQTDIYTDAAQLEVNPAPDTLIRVFMAWQAADSYVDISGQELSTPERIGFTVVE